MQIEGTVNAQNTNANRCSQLSYSCLPTKYNLQNITAEHKMSATLPINKNIDVYFHIDKKRDK